MANNQLIRKSSRGSKSRKNGGGIIKVSSFLASAAKKRSNSLNNNSSSSINNNNNRNENGIILKKNNSTRKSFPEGITYPISPISASRSFSSSSPSSSSSPLLQQQNHDKSNTLFPQYSHYTLITLENLIHDISNHMWIKPNLIHPEQENEEREKHGIIIKTQSNGLSDTTTLGSSTTTGETKTIVIRGVVPYWLRDAISFQSKMPTDCVLKSHIIGILGIEDATGVDRRLLQLSRSRYLKPGNNNNNNNTNKESEINRQLEPPKVWIISVDAQDIKQVIILKSSFFKRLDELCEIKQEEQNENNDLMIEEIWKFLMNFHFPELFATSSFSTLSTSHSNNNNNNNPNLNPQEYKSNLAVYRLFREFLKSFSGISNMCSEITEIDFLNFEKEWLEKTGQQQLQIEEEKEDMENINIKSSCLWKFRHLLVNAGYLTLIPPENSYDGYSHVTSVTNNNDGSSSVNSHHDFGSSSGNGFNNGMDASFNDAYDDDFQFETQGINLNQGSNDVENNGALRLSIPNIGNLISVARHARRWIIIDVIMGGRRRSSGYDKIHNNRDIQIGLSSSSSSSSSPNNRKSSMMIPEHEIRERWANKKTQTIFQKFKGINLNWVILDAYGGGWIEPFNTPVGICWKYTGKALTK